MGSARQPTPWAARATWLVCLVVAVVMLVLPVGRSGMWDPYELDRSDLARRVAVLLFDAPFADAQGAPPTLGDLGMGELPIVSMALGVRLFGAEDWAGRLPLACWAAFGALAMAAFFMRHVSRRAALYACVVLCTTPLYFMQARTMLGDVVAMACVSACFFGLLAALLETRRASERLASLAIAAVGALGGYFTRGALLGVAVPMVAVGLAWAIADASSPRRDRRGEMALGLTALGVGALAAGAAIAGLASLRHGDLEVWRVLGVAAAPKAVEEATFDRTLRDLGHALFPWSALLPVALGRLLVAPKHLEPEARRAHTMLRAALWLGLALSYLAHAHVAVKSGPLPPTSVAFVAAAIGLCAHDWDRGARPSAAMVLASTVLAAVLLSDLWREPNATLAVFGLPDATAPLEGVTARKPWLAAAALLLSGGALAAAVERDAAMTTRLWWQGRIGHYRRVAERLASIWNGNLAFGFLVVEAALVGLGGMLLLGSRFGWASVANMSESFRRVGVNLWWAFPLGALGATLGVDLARAAAASVLERLRAPRAASLVGAGAAAGALLSFGYYPALADQLSPKDVFVALDGVRRPGEPLSVLSLRAGAARFYGGGTRVMAHTSPGAAFHWLTRPEPGAAQGALPRRFLILRRRDLPALNAQYRGLHQRNLPIATAPVGAMLIASNDANLGRGHNPLDAWVSSDAPRVVQHPLACDLGGRLTALGWEVRDDAGRLVEAVAPGRRYALTFFYRVESSPRHNWKAFLHIDGGGRRHNGDRDVLGGDYPMVLWRPGDIVRDRYELELPPNFTPRRYAVRYGFFRGKRRMKVKGCDGDDNRISGGVLRVK